MLAGFDDEAAFELSCEKWRVDGGFKSAASGAVLEATGVGLRSKLEAVEAANLLRDAIVEVEASGGRRTRGAPRSSIGVGASARRRVGEVHDITTPALTFIDAFAPTFHELEIRTRIPYLFLLLLRSELVTM